jgi:methylmalonyl-CoA carboxyltransferase 5S subunit
MFPQVAPRFFATRDQGPKNVSKDLAAQSAAAAAPPPAASAPDASTGPVRTTITYDVRLNGKTHKVTVSPT